MVKHTQNGQTYCKFAAYFQNTFSYENLCRSASEVHNIVIQCLWWKLEMLKFSVIFFALLYYNFYLYFFISKLPMVGMNRTVMTGSGWTLKKPVNAVTQPEVIISKIATVQLLPYTVHQEYFFSPSHPTPEDSSCSNSCVQISAPTAAL